jgi:hypothetical protein
VPSLLILSLADVGTPNIGFIAEVHYGIIGSENLSPGTEYEYYIEAQIA